MTEKLQLSLTDFAVTFKISSNAKKQTNIQFYISFFNRFPELIHDNCSDELHALFLKLTPAAQDITELQDYAQKFVTIINESKFNSVTKNYRDLLKEEAILYIHLCARLVFDYIYQTTNLDMFVPIDDLVHKINYNLKFDDYIIPWYDYTQEKLDTLDCELSKMDEKDSSEKFHDYFHSLLNNELNLIHRTSDKVSIEDDYNLQKIIAGFYFNSLPEEKNLLPYLLRKILSGRNTSASIFEIHSFIPLNEEYAINFIITAKIVDNEIVFGDKNPIFFNIIAKALGSYFSKTKKDSNLFIRAINPEVEIMSFNKEMIKETNQLNEIYGFFFNEDFAYGMSKSEIKQLLENDLYTLKYKKPKAGTFYIDSADLFAEYATDKALSLILGDYKLSHKA